MSNKPAEFPKRPQECEILTPPGRIFWAHILTPKPPSDDGQGPDKARFTCDFAIDKEVCKQAPEWERLFGAIKHYAAEKFSKAELSSSNFKPGFRNGDEFKDEQYHNCIILRPWSNASYPPSVMDTEKQAVSGDTRIAIGANARLIVSPFTFNNKTKGVGLNLKAVWLVGGDPIVAERDYSSALEGVEGLPDYASAPRIDSPEGEQSDPFKNAF